MHRDLAFNWFTALDPLQTSVRGTSQVTVEGVPANLINAVKDEDKDLFIGEQEFVEGYSKAPEQPQSSAPHICHSYAMARTGCEPATIRICSPRYALHYGRRHLHVLTS